MVFINEKIVRLIVDFIFNKVESDYVREFILKERYKEKQVKEIWYLLSNKKEIPKNLIKYLVYGNYLPHTCVNGISNEKLMESI